MTAKCFCFNLWSVRTITNTIEKYATNTTDGKLITAFTRQMLDEHWRGEGISQVHITTLDPRPVDGQLELFEEDDHAQHSDRQAVNNAMDTINQRYGELTLGPARLLKRSDMPNVISPAWKPSGPRQSI